MLTSNTCGQVCEKVKGGLQSMFASLVNLVFATVSLLSYLQSSLVARSCMAFAFSLSYLSPLLLLQSFILVVVKCAHRKENPPPCTSLPPPHASKSEVRKGVRIHV
mmetsp:Transcript_36067/g.93800  ORF Transcript_36067/g.93800 Transcript_36067/m.93800 type:complete len:106 (-) Transcript_36067:143-460(-)